MASIDFELRTSRLNRRQKTWSALNSATGPDVTLACGGVIARSGAFYGFTYFFHCGYSNLL
jgi:hypothetical protein